MKKKGRCWVVEREREREREREKGGLCLLATIINSPDNKHNNVEATRPMWRPACPTRRRYATGRRVGRVGETDWLLLLLLLCVSEGDAADFRRVAGRPSFMLYVLRSVIISYILFFHLPLSSLPPPLSSSSYCSFSSILPPPLPSDFRFLPSQHNNYTYCKNKYGSNPNESVTRRK